MSDSTRRGFIAMAGAGAAVGAVALVAPTAAGAAPAHEDTSLPTGATGAMAAYIHDLGKGEVLLMVEGREVVVTDRALVSKLAHAFAKASTSTSA